MVQAFGIIGRVAILLLLLYVMIRWLGKKHLTQMTIFEYISGIVLGGVVAIHISSHSYPLLHGVIAMLSWTFLIVCIDTISLKSKRFREFVHGQSRMLIVDGEFIYDHLQGERMTTDELLETLRTRNINQLSDVEFAQLEPSGKLNIRTYDSENESYYAHNTFEEIQKKTSQLMSKMEEAIENPNKEDILSALEELKHINSTLTNHENDRNMVNTEGTKND